MWIALISCTEFAGDDVFTHFCLLLACNSKVALWIVIKFRENGPDFLASLVLKSPEKVWIFHPDNWVGAVSAVLAFQ